MSSQRSFSVGVAVITLGLGLLLLAPAARATVYYWDSTSGTGTWLTSLTSWLTSTTSAASLAWTNTGPNDAYFYGSHSGGETITISNLVVVGNITFAGTTYTLTGGTVKRRHLAAQAPSLPTTTLPSARTLSARLL